MQGKLKSKLNNKSGMTMVSVLVAFAIFMSILLMFQQTVRLASNIFQTAEDVRRNTEGLYSSFYENTTYSQKDKANDFSDKGQDKVYTFSNGSESFTLKSFEGYYEDSGSKVYFFGNRSHVKDGA